MAQADAPHPSSRILSANWALGESVSSFFRSINTVPPARAVLKVGNTTLRRSVLNHPHSFSQMFCQTNCAPRDSEVRCSDGTGFRWRIGWRVALRKRYAGLYILVDPAPGARPEASMRLEGSTDRVIGVETLHIVMGPIRVPEAPE